MAIEAVEGERGRSYQKRGHMAKKAAKRVPRSVAERLKVQAARLRRQGLREYRGPSRTPRDKALALVGRAELLPPADEQRIVTAEGMDLGALGLVELKLSKKEEAILAEPIDPALVQWRARERNGPPEIPYYPHNEYTRWFNRAFGRLGWALVPIAKPSITPGKNGALTVSCPYVLHIHGKPVAFAIGEHEYFENNKQQTYGDALESTVANALRRCAKRIGVGLELWDRDWRIRHMPSEARSALARDPDVGNERRPDVAHRQPPGEAHHANANDLITPAQRKRLRAIINNSGRRLDAVADWIRRIVRQPLDDNGEPDRLITRRQYDPICDAIESHAELPAVLPVR